ncbi:MAG: extracellular solute-binding protein [Candidatus Sumerlaeota bacterium]|nr:extracellular solute-binding protein [Candidatus Sumerlaeota bacterium]
MADLVDVPDSLVSVLDRARREFLKDLKGGVYVSGSVLPPQRALAARYSVSVAAIHRMLVEMNAGGLVRTVHGKGSYILATPEELDPARERKLLKATLILPTEAHFGSEAVAEHERFAREIDHEFLLGRPDYRIRYRPLRTPLKGPLLGDHEIIAITKGYSLIQFQHPSAPTLAKEGALEDLSERARAAEIERRYEKRVWNACWSGRRLAGLPVRLINPVVVFYNREMVARYAPGVDMSALSWDEFVPIADAVARGARLDAPVAISHELIPARWILTLLAQVNGYTQGADGRASAVRFDPDAFVEAFGKVREAFLRFRMADAPDLWSNRQQVDSLVAGRNAFFVADTLYTPVDPDRIGVMPLPVLAGGVPRQLVVLTMAGIRRSNSRAVRDAAWEYLLFHARPEYAARACQRGVERANRLVYRSDCLAGWDLRRSQPANDSREQFLCSDAPLEDCLLEPVSPSFTKGVLSRLFLLEALFSRTTDWRKRVLDLVEGANRRDGEREMQ